MLLPSSAWASNYSAYPRPANPANAWLAVPTVREKVAYAILIPPYPPKGGGAERGRGGGCVSWVPRAVVGLPRGGWRLSACGGSSFSFVVRLAWLRCLLVLAVVFLVRRCVWLVVRVFVCGLVARGCVRGVCVGRVRGFGRCCVALVWLSLPVSFVAGRRSFSRSLPRVCGGRGFRRQD